MHLLLLFSLLGSKHVMNTGGSLCQYVAGLQLNGQGSDGRQSDPWISGPVGVET